MDERPAAPPPRRSLARRALVPVAVLLALTAAGVIGLAAWITGTSTGTAWLLARIPGLTVDAPQGRLAGGDLVAGRLRLAWSGGRGALDIEGLELRGLRWHWRPVPGQWLALEASAAHARRVRLQLPPPTAAAPQVPATLRSPLGLDVAGLQIGELQVDALPAWRAVAARRLQLGADGGRRHGVEGLAFDWERIAAHDGRVSLAAEAPFALDAALEGRAREGRPWQARLTATGALERIDLAGTLRGDPVPGHAPPALDAEVRLQPFEAWPLGALSLRSEALDLAALSAAAPTTRLDGRAVVRTAGRPSPLQADIDVTNARPGRWDRAQLPLRELRATLRADPQRPQRLELPSFALVLADDAGEAGRWQGQAHLDGTTLTLESRFAELRPQRLDARAAAMRLSGPFAITLHGLPATLARAAAPGASGASGAAGASAASGPPGPAATVAPRASAAAGVAGGPAPAASAPSPDASTAGTTAAWRQLRAAFRLQLAGTLDRPNQPVELVAAGEASAQRLELRTLQARAGDARAQGALTLQFQPGQRWQLASRGELAQFDPVPWFPGPDGSAWRRGPHRLNARWTLNLALPDRALRLPPLQWLQSLAGDGDLQVADSRLAGIPVQGRISLARDPAAPVAQRSHAQARLEIGRNVLTVDGRGDPVGSGESDRWQVAVQAPALQDLAPIGPLLADDGWMPRQGSAEARLDAQGRWPALRAEGEVGVGGLQAAALSIGRLRASGRVDLGAAQSLDLQLEGSQIGSPSGTVESLRGRVRGTLSAHELSGELVAPVLPPAWLERALGLRSGKGTQLQLAGDGGWTREPGGGGVWRGRLARLAAGVWTGSGPADASWFDSSDLQGDLRFDASGRLTSLAAPAGRARLAGGIALRWSSLGWRGDAPLPAFTLQAEVEPVTVAPILQRLSEGGRNPTQWGGDLRLVARLDVRAADTVEAQLQLRRHDGDLSYAEGGQPQWLGLTDVDFSLVARDGEWRFQPLFVGRTLGTISGAVTAYATPQARWPGPQARIDGAVGVQVPSLGVWAGWLPPGWRIEGAMTTSARVAGTLGAPEYTGELQASGVGLRNLLQGIDLRDGELRVVLKGENAQIERLAIRGGDGTLTGTGRASFGSAPQATLELEAAQFRVLGRVDRQLAVSGRTALALQTDRLRLEGRVAVDGGLFDLSARDAPTLDDDVVVRRAPGTATLARPEPAPTAPVLRNAAVALEVDLGRQLRLRGRGLDTRLAGQLRVSAPGGRIAIDGTVRAEDGTYAAYGQKLEIDRGLVTFAGPVDGARLDILALRPNLDQRVGVAITGTALNPRVRLYSEPEMGETDKLSWLVLGRGPDGLGRTDTALLQRAAVALLAGEGEGPADGLIRAIGLDDISVRQTDGEVRETVISLGKQLSRRWYVGYERGVNATTGTWQLTYRVAQRFTLRAQSGLENSLDLIWTWRFGRP